jgi:hypothetical protein
MITDHRIGRKREEMIETPKVFEGFESQGIRKNIHRVCDYGMNGFWTASKRYTYPIDLLQVMDSPFIRYMIGDKLMKQNASQTVTYNNGFIVMRMDMLQV